MKVTMHNSLTRVLTSLGAIALLTLPPVAAAEEPQWQLETADEDIRIYSRPVEGSPFLAVKAVTRMTAPLKSVVHEMGDGNGCAKWRSMCKSSRILEEVSERERYVYVVLDLPWPLSDRDMVVHSRASVDEGAQTVSVTFETVSDRLPPQDLVRAESSASYTIQAIEEQVVEFTYIMHTDLGGKVPVDQFNSRLLDATRKDMQQLLKLIEG